MKILSLLSTSPQPTHTRTSWWQRTVWVALRVVVVAWLLTVLAWGALHALILPRIVEHQNWLQQQASRAVGLRVQLGELSVGGGWWVPWLQVDGVGLFDAQGREVLHLNHVTLAFSPRSLLHGGFEQVLIDQPELDIRRDAQGHVWVAGLDMQAEETDTGAADWFFSQSQWVIREGILRWRDESKQGEAAPVLALEKVNLTVLNHGQQHDVRMDATPPSRVGERLSVRGQFAQPLLARAGDWGRWDGEMFVHLPYADLTELRQWMALDQGVSLQEGRGALRAWMDVVQGRPVGVTTDVTLDAVNVRLGKNLQPLRLKQVQGRMGVRWQHGAYEVSSQDLAFETFDGERWPGGDVRLAWLGDDALTGSLSADRLDLGALSQVAQRLPLPARVREALLTLKPRGQVNKLQANWEMPAKRDMAELRYTVKGQLHQFGLQRNAQAQALWAQWPGIENASLDFDATQQGGKARLSFQRGSVTLPAGLDEPRIALDDASAQMTWQQTAQNWQVQISQASVRNADVTGEFKGSWKTGVGDKRFPGVLDLSADLTRVNVAHVHRYLPKVLSAQVRQYVQQAVVKGEGSEVKLRLRGDLRDMPFDDPKQGEFRVVTQLTKGVLAYVPHPPTTTAAATHPSAWPDLEDIEGELVFERRGLQFKGKTHLTHAPHVTWHKVTVAVPDLSNPVVAVNGEGRGPLREVLATVNRSALNALIGGALNQSQATGEGDYNLALTVPVNALDKTQLTGRVLFKNNELQVAPGTPVLRRVRGELQFGQADFRLKDLKAQTLGGDVTAQGGLTFAAAPGAAAPPLKIQGYLTAEGLRQAKEMGFVSRLALSARGRADYQVTVGLKRGEPEWVITSDLKGMALALPPPLNKLASTSLPLRVETQLTQETLAAKSKVLQDQLRLTLGKLIHVAYVRDVSQPEAKVLSGAIAVGTGVTDDLVLRDRGVNLNLALTELDVDAWSDVLTQWTGVPVGVSQPGAKTEMKPASVVEGVVADTQNALDYVPSVVAVRAEQLKLSDRVLHQVLVGGTRVGDLWRLNVSAQELNGALELRPPQDNTPAQLYARLSYLNIPPSLVDDVESMLSQQPSSIPALDVVVNDVTLRGKKLGRLEIEAVNQAGATPSTREWHLKKFNLWAPEASLTAKGDWIADGPSSRRTHMNFTLEVRDSGQLLERMGTPNVVREGHGTVQGQLTWRGSPITLDYPSMSGQVNLNIEKGQFLKTEPGAAKLLGVLNLQALPRRLALDFNDVFSEGFAFDFFRGDARIDQGVAHTNNLQMKGVVAGALIEGRADLARETQDLKVVVVPDINAGAASLYMATINPLVGLTSYLAQLLLSKPLVKAGTSEFRIDGSWSKPRVTEVN